MGHLQVWGAELMRPPLTAIPVFFLPEMVALDASTSSPSAAKPAQVVLDWQAQRLPIQLFDFEPVDADTVALAHDRVYVREVLAGKTANGFGNRKPQVTASLPFTTGSMLAAASAALDNGLVACAPVSGFHHAGYSSGGGFCTFNGLVVAAMALKQEGRVSRVGILDLDQHWGDGTHDIIRRLDLCWILHHSAGREAPDASQSQRYLRELPDLVSSFRACDLLLYQAGADAHVNDPLGGWMTSEQLAERDRIVFTVAKEIGVPVSWNLAGGYQRDAQGGIEPVLAIHRRTMLACADVFVGCRSSQAESSRAALIAAASSLRSERPSS